MIKNISQFIPPFTFRNKRQYLSDLDKSFNDYLKNYTNPSAISTNEDKSKIIDNKTRQKTIEKYSRKKVNSIADLSEIYKKKNENNNFQEFFYMFDDYKNYKYKIIVAPQKNTKLPKLEKLEGNMQIFNNKIETNIVKKVLRNSKSQDLTINTNLENKNKFENSIFIQKLDKRKNSRGLLDKIKSINKPIINKKIKLPKIDYKEKKRNTSPEQLNSLRVNQLHFEKQDEIYSKIKENNIKISEILEKEILKQKKNAIYDSNQTLNEFLKLCGKTNTIVYNKKIGNKINK